MKTLIKIVGVLIGVVVVVIIAAVILVPIFVDPNDYKEQLAGQVKAQTGRDLTVEGNIKLSVFPWLGLNLGTVELGNAPGFAEPYMARSEEIDIRVKLLPLLSREVEMGKVVIKGLSLRLEKNQDGRTNFEDLQGKPQADAPAATSAPTGAEKDIGLAAFGIGGLDLQDANLVWNDRQSGERISLSEINATTSALAPGAPVELDIAFRVDAEQAQVSGDLSASATLEMDQRGETFEAQSLKLAVKLTGPSVPEDALDAELSANIQGNLAQQTLDLRDLKLELMGVSAVGALAVTNMLAQPNYTATVELKEFSPRELLRKLGVELESQDPDALGAFSGSLSVEGSNNELRLTPVKFRLDDTNLDGTVAITNLATAALRFDLNIDNIDADRYLPPEAQGQAASPGAAATQATQLPLETLRALDVEGRLAVGRLKISNLSVTEISAPLQAKNGLIALEPIGAKLYDGTYEGHMKLDARGKEPALSVDERLLGVQAGPLLKDFQGEERITGTANAHAKLSAKGVDTDTFVKTLNGAAAFAFTDGALKGVNIARKIREAKALIQGRSLPPSDEPEETDFTELKGTLNFTNGLGTNDDLSAKSPLLRILGKGQVDLPSESIDYLLTTELVATVKGQGGAELDDLVGVPIPIRISGSFKEPKYAVDVQALAQSLAKSKAGEVVDEKVGKELEKRLGTEGAEDAKKLLKGLFN